MADPRIVSVQDRRPMRSELMAKLDKASTRADVNACPYGCQTEHLDPNGYCRHLAGFTLPGDRTRMEPLVREKNRTFTDGTKVEPVRPADQLIEITTSCRVYRNVDAEDKPAPKKAG